MGLGIPNAIATSRSPPTRTVQPELRGFEKWLARGGVWAAQPALALLTTCGTADKRGLKAGTGPDGRVTDATAAAAGEFVGPSDYPTDEALAEMVDSYEALICWYYLPAGNGSASASGSSGTNENGGVSDGDDNNNEGNFSGRSAGGSGIACFVAYRDQGNRRHTASTDIDNSNGARARNPQVAELEQKRAAIKARARVRRRDEENGSQGSGSSSSSGSSDGGNGREEDLNANDFDPGALRVRVMLTGPGTAEQLRKATGVFLSAARNRNPVRSEMTEWLAPCMALATACVVIL